MMPKLDIFRASSTLVLLMILAYSQGGSAVDVRFWEHPNFQGNWYQVQIYPNSGCFDFPREWKGRISSLDSDNVCIVVSEYARCGGRSEQITLPQNNLARVNFDNRISSFRLCSDGNDVPCGGVGSSGPNKGQKCVGPTERPDSGRPDGGHNNGDSNDYRRVMLEEHNNRRRRHGSPDLSWDSQVEAAAQRHCDSLARTGQFHNSDNGYGENLAWSNHRTKGEALGNAMKIWYDDQVRKYNYNNPGFSRETGGFTQVVWKNSRSLGIGVSWDQKRRAWLMCANYSPAGNINGQFRENVFPPRT